MKTRGKIEYRVLLLPLIVVFSTGGLAEAASLFTHPILMVCPAKVSFGQVAVGASATNTVLVQNAGGGRLVGKATVPAPFKIISGGQYSLAPNEVQIVTIVYGPSGASTDQTTVRFTGDREVNVRVMGRPLPERRRASRRSP